MKAPGNWTIDTLFEGRPVSRGLFVHVRSYIESLGDIKVEAAKTQVSFGAKRKFAWVWLPQMWIKKAPPDSIVLSFDLPRKVEDPRIKQSVEPYPGRWTHHVVIERPEQLDTQVKAWLTEAYRLVG
jgi:hypothetical protein